MSGKAILTRVALVFAIAVPIVGLAIAAGLFGSSDSTAVSAQASAAGSGLPKGWVSTDELVERHEALPCTGPKDPINFEIFSAGPDPAGLPLSGTSRRCDEGPNQGWRANYVNYSYGHCEIPKGETGCQLPLAIQTWPACERSMADYSFEGKPLPHRRLPNLGGAAVVEFNFKIERRIEVYTKAATIVIFATDPNLARRVLPLLIPQETERPPATNAAALRGSAPEKLAPPNKGSMEGDLSCQS